MSWKLPEPSEYFCLHDAIFDACGVSFPDNVIKMAYELLPLPVQEIGMNHGWTDTVFGDEACKYYKEHPLAIDQLKTAQCFMKQLGL